MRSHLRRSITVRALAAVATMWTITAIVAAPASADPTTTTTPSTTPDQTTTSLAPTSTSQDTTTTVPSATRKHAVAAPATATPDLAGAVRFLATSTNNVAGGTSLGTDGYYQIFTGFADWGLTIDGAFALAAAGTEDTTLAKVVNFINDDGKDPSGNTINTWSGIGTQFASGGSLGKEALLAEITGFDPHHFGGKDVLAALDASACTTSDATTGCDAPGNYTFAESTFDQALGVIAQLRAGDSANATAPIAYLEGLQHANGSWPSVIPASASDSDVDSTGMAVMALALVPGDTAAAAVRKGIAWIAAQQRADGGFPGAAGDSTNSAALAIMGLRLDENHFDAGIDKALAFLAGQQNTDGGFTVAAGGQPGSDVRATAQVVSGIVGTSFATLSDDVSTVAPTARSTPPATGAGAPLPTKTTARAAGAGRPEPLGTGRASSGVGSRRLAFTGVNDVFPLLGMGFLLVVAGTGVLLARRRRDVRQR